VCAANAGAAREGKYTITLVDYPDIKKDVTVNQEAGA
jgi:hypothetical protein